MENKQDLPAVENKAQLQRMAGRQASIAAGAVFFGIMIGHGINEGMIGQPLWLRLLVTAAAGGVMAGIFVVVLGKLWRR